MITISDLINSLDDVDSFIEEMNQLPEEKINLVRLKINELIELLDDLSTEYGDEHIEDNYDEDNDNDF
jgi:hypothetical protein